MLSESSPTVHPHHLNRVLPQARALQLSQQQSVVPRHNKHQIQYMPFSPALQVGGVT